MASLAPSGGGGGTVSVDAPWRISRNGHETFGCAFVTGCGSFCVAPEKKVAILSLNDGLLGAADEAVAGAPDDAVVAGGPADAVVAGPPNPPPLQPAVSDANTSSAAVGARLCQPIPQISRNFFRVIANFASPAPYNKPTVAIPRHHPTPPGTRTREGDALWLRQTETIRIRLWPHPSGGQTEGDPARCR